MIVRTKLLGGDAVLNDAFRVGNIKALTIAQKLRWHYSSASCPHHPWHEQVIHIVVYTDGTLDIDLSGLCCEEFKGRITITA